MTRSTLRRAFSAAFAGAREGRAARRARDNRSSFWWPRTDSIEHARKAALGASWAFGLTTISFLAFSVFCIFKGYALTPDGCAAVLCTALFVYLTWRSYARPTVLLSSLAFGLMAFVLAFNVALFVAVDKPAYAGALVRASFLPFLALIAALGGVRGSIALRRFTKPASPSLSGGAPGT